MENDKLLYPVSISDLFPEDVVRDWIDNGKELIFKKGEEIIKPTNMTNSIFMIKEGKAHIFHMHGDGKECVVGILSKGDFIHLLDIFTEHENEVFAKALTDIKISLVDKKEIKNVVRKSPDLAMQLLSNFSWRLQEMIEVLSQVAYGKVEERLLFLFKKLADGNKKVDGWVPISVSMTHQDIAGMVASTRETVTVLINKLMQRGILRQSNNKIWIKNDEL
jgi:CRP/FNR family transcriptional regulator